MARLFIGVKAAVSGFRCFESELILGKLVPVKDPESSPYIFGAESNPPLSDTVFSEVNDIEDITMQTRVVLLLYRQQKRTCMSSSGNMHR